MCGGPQWKREVVPDHKFDFVDTRDFTDNSCWMRTRYTWVYVLVLKSFLVYVSDIFTAITMLTTDNWSNRIFDSCTQSDHNGCVFIPFGVGKWLFVGCIIFSFLLLAYESRKARKIIISRDISYAFTNILANNYYSLRSYDHFCFFCHINNSTKKKDDFAFFVFFTFKSWKRLLLADGPRQVINGLTLYSFYLSQKDNGSFWDLKKYTGGSIMTTGLIFSTLFTCLIFIGSALLLVAAGICYIPLLCYIRGNLKEYCCHKVDKRIAEIVKRKNKERFAKAAILAKKEAMGDFSHLKNKKGEFIHNPLPQPTLPKIAMDDELDDSASARTRVPQGGNYPYKGDYYYGSDMKGGNFPPVPQQQYYYPPAPAPAPSGYAISTDELQPPYDDEYSSTVNLTQAAAPIARQNSEGPDQPPIGVALTTDYPLDPRELYHTGYHVPQHQHQYGGGVQNGSGGMYDAPSRDYQGQNAPRYPGVPSALMPGGNTNPTSNYGSGNGSDQDRDSIGLAYDDAAPEYASQSSGNSRVDPTHSQQPPPAHTQQYTQPQQQYYGQR